MIEKLTAIIQQFLGILKTSDLTAEQRLRALPKALDDLAYMVHQIPRGDCSGSFEPPKRPFEHYQERYQAISKLFPDLGYYIAANHIMEDIDTPLVGDAIDDLADIESDLEEVIWHWKHNGENDAFWQFRFGFNSHWGKHLRDLNGNLHAKYADKNLFKLG